ncbi:unnamed protein product, partial [Rotaria socialis]
GGGGGGGGGGGSGGGGGGGGGGGDGGGGGGGYYGGSGASCEGDDCRTAAIIMGSIFGGVFGLCVLIPVLILIITRIHSCCQCCKGWPFQKNSTFVKFPNLKSLRYNASNINHFQSGIWTSQYFQYKSWHGPYHLSLFFDHQSLRVTGSGSDDIGSFTIDGIYSIQTQRIGLTKTYAQGTGNLSENFGHDVIIQLKWNSKNSQFEGKWYVKTRITVECQGGGGGGSGGGGFSGGSHHYWSSSSSCRGSACPSRTVLWLSIVGGITGFVLLVVGIIYCKKSCTGQPSRSNVVFVQKNSQKNYELENYDSSIFKSGHWKSQYLQYGRWHGPHRCSLVFNGHSMSIKGSGSDDIGTFTLDGVYASQTQRIGLTKTYQRGTGNLSENLGHQVTIQLKWCPENNQFEGKWYVQTPKYHGDDKFVLKFDGQHIETVYEKV